MSIFYIISDVFVAAMAVFGFWCVFQFFMIDFPTDRSLCCAVALTDKEDLKELSTTISVIETSHLLRSVKPKGCDKYPVLIPPDITLTPDDIKNIPENAQLYVRIDDISAVQTKIKKE